MPRSRTSIPLAVLPLAPTHNDLSPYLNQLIRALTLSLNALNNPGQIRGTDLVLTELPTSGVGLPVNSVYVDEEGYLRMVMTNLPLVTGASATAAMGSVTVVIS